MNLLKKLFTRNKKEYKPVVLAEDLTKHMIHSRTIPVRNVNIKSKNTIRNRVTY